MAREGLAFYGVDAGALHGANLLAVPGSLWRLWRGYGQARRLLPSFGRGGAFYRGIRIRAGDAGCGPRGLPGVDLPAGRGAGVGHQVALAPGEAGGGELSRGGHFLSAGQAFVSGYPVRRALYTTPRAQARAALGLSDELPALLVLGGSLGAHSLNEAVRAHLGDVLGLAQVVHVCGQRDEAALQAARAALPEGLRARYHLYAYLYEGMTDALVAADLAVTRGGASVLGEYPAAGLPAVVVPYPHTGPNQQVNADYLAQHGAAVAMADAALAAELWPTVRGC